MTTEQTSLITGACVTIAGMILRHFERRKMKSKHKKEIDGINKVK